jgi:hypothetical protein
MSLVRFRSHWMSASRSEILKAVIDPSHAPEGVTATGMASLGVAPHVVERILNHVSGGNARPEKSAAERAPSTAS